MRSHDEIDMDATTERLILRDSLRWGVNRERMRYYVQFGCGAPTWPDPSRRARRWLRQLDKTGGS